MRIGELLSYDEVQRNLKEGFITERAHPDFPDRLFILNYTEKAQYEREWNHTTKTCRGVIYDLRTGQVLARPLGKFFNYGDEASTGQIDLDTPIMGAWDKLDGSLGIAYNRPDGKQAIATRGSFASDQALHATAMVQDRPSYLAFPERTTFLYEIIYPENRIVLDYGQRDELVFLGSVEIATGAYTPPPGRGGSGAAERLQLGGTLREVLALEDRPNREGVVVWFDKFTALKIKQEDYVQLHKIVTGLNRKTIWRALRDDETDYLLQLPDEFFEWASGIRDELVMAAYAIELRAIDAFNDIITELGPSDGSKEYRKAFAAKAGPHELRSYLFALLDERDIYGMTIAAVEPKGTE